MAEVQQLADGTMRWLNQRDLNADMIIGGPSVPDGGANPRYISDTVVKLTLQPVAGAGGVAAWQNAFPYAINIIGCLLDVITGSAGQTLSIGTAANGTTSASNLQSVVSIANPSLFGSRTNFAKLAAGSWVTATASGTPTGLVGCLYLEFFPAT